MYHIEVLPQSTSRSAPGYTYIADSQYIDPSKAAILPSGSRKRSRHSTAASSSLTNTSTSLNPSASTSATTNQNDALVGTNTALSARAASKIAKHIADLDRENHRDVAPITIPGKSKDVAQRGISHAKGRVMTSGVRKIMASQKAWGNWLADEEAALALRPVSSSGGGIGAGGVSVGIVGAGGSAGTVKKEEKGEAQLTSAERKRIRDREAKAAKRRKSSTLRGVENVEAREEVEEGTEEAKPTPVPEAEADAQAEAMDIDAYSSTLLLQSTPSANLLPTTTDDTADDDTPTLPPHPTPSELASLLSHPPLSYNASRAAPSTSTAPPRKFCEMCGYWGRVVCVKCGARVCGRECLGGHEEGGCLRFYA